MQGGVTLKDIRTLCRAYTQPLYVYGTLCQFTGAAVRRLQRQLEAQGGTWVDYGGLRGGEQGSGGEYSSEGSVGSGDGSEGSQGDEGGEGSESSEDE